MTLVSTQRGQLPYAILLALAALCCGPVAAQQGYQHALPADTLVFLGIDDTTAYADGWAGSALGTFWASDRMQPTRASIARDFEGVRAKLKDEVGVDLLGLPEMIEGALAFALVDLALPVEGRSGEPSLAVCLLADFGQQREECQDMLERLVEKALEQEHQAVLKREEIGGLAVTAIVSTEDDHDVQVRYAFHGNTLIAMIQSGTLERDPFLRVVDGLDGRADATLDASAGFRSSLAAGQRSGVRFYADAGRILGRVLDGVKRSGELDDQEAQMLGALGLRELGVLSMSMECGATGSTAALRLDWPGDGWIQQIMRNLCKPGPFPSARYVSADVSGFTAINADLPGMFDTVSKMLIDMRAITPADLVHFLAESEGSLGFNPREDLLELFTGEFIVIMDDVEAAEALPFVAGDSSNYALIVGLNDGAACTTLVDGVIRKSGFHVGRKSEEFQGFQVYQVPMPMMPVSLGYAILDDMAVLSLSPTMLRDVLRRRASGNLPNITGTTKYVEAVAKVKPGYGMIGFSDTASDMKQLVRTLRTLPGLIQAEVGDMNPLAWLAQLPLPDESLIDEHFTGGTASVCTIDKRGFSFESAGP
jgi:hypothetical protein